MTIREADNPWKLFMAHSWKAKEPKGKRKWFN